MSILPKLFGDQCRKLIFDHNPLAFILSHDFLALVRQFSAFAADEMSEVGLIIHHAIDCDEVPLIRVFAVFPSCLLCLISGWCDDFLLCQHTGDFVVAIAMERRHFKHPAYSWRGFFIELQHMLIGFTFLQAICSL